MAAIVPILNLNDGNKMPALGLGTWKSSKNEVFDAVVSAVKDFGYRHIDCALAYQNEEEVGKALKFLFENNIIKREEIFVTSKLWSTYHSKERVLEGILTTLKDLGLDYLDLYLIHLPIGFKEGPELFPRDENGKLQYTDIDYLETYNSMLKLKKDGKVKSIGVSNFNIEQIERLINETGVVPAVNQIESHPYLTQKPLIDYCFKNKINITAYSPLGFSRPGRENTDPVLLNDIIIKEIAIKYKKTPAQILIKFHLNRKLSVIPKSVKRERIQQNIDILDFDLNSDDIKQLEELNKDFHYSSLHLFSDHQYYPLK